MERAVAEAIGLIAPVAPAVPSSFKVRGYDRVTHGHDVGGRGAARGAGAVVDFENKTVDVNKKERTCDR